MYQAIETKFAGPTDTRGSRVIASCWAGRRIVAWNHALNSSQNHTNAAAELAAKLDWSGAWHGGASAKGSGYVFVNVDGAAPDFVVQSKG